jgi:hypothetical protein
MEVLEFLIFLYRNIILCLNSGSMIGYLKSTMVRILLILSILISGRNLIRWRGKRNFSWGLKT